MEKHRKGCTKPCKTRKVTQKCVNAGDDIQKGVKMYGVQKHKNDVQGGARQAKPHIGKQKAKKHPSKNAKTPKRKALP